MIYAIERLDFELRHLTLTPDEREAKQARRAAIIAERNSIFLLEQAIEQRWNLKLDVAAHYEPACPSGEEGFRCAGCECLMHERLRYCYPCRAERDIV